MYAQLGNIRFEGLKGFSSFSHTVAVAYAQHARINGKSRLEATGDELDAISIEILLHANFTNPEADIEEMRAAMYNREILKLILGNGNIVGDFVISSFEKVIDFTDPKGNIISVTLSVELLESYNENPLSEAQKNAMNSAFATTARNSNVRSVLPAKPSPAMGVTLQVSEIKASAIQINQYTAAAEANENTFEYYSGKIDSNLNDIEDNISNIQASLSDAQDIADLAASLPEAIQDINTRVQNIKAVLPISDIAQFKILNSQLQGSVLAAKTANTGISNQSIIRRK